MSLEASLPTSKTAIASLVFAILCMPVGLILAIIALVQISKAGKDRLGGQVLAIIALCLAFAWIPVSGCMAAIAVPGFVQFQCRSKQSEAKAGLKSAFVSMQSYHAEHATFGSLEEAGFDAQPVSRRYRYEITERGKDDFVIRATATSSDVEGDVWEITEQNVLTNVANGCR